MFDGFPFFFLVFSRLIENQAGLRNLTLDDTKNLHELKNL